MTGQEVRTHAHTKQHKKKGYSKRDAIVRVNNIYAVHFSGANGDGDGTAPDREDPGESIPHAGANKGPVPPAAAEGAAVPAAAAAAAPAGEDAPATDDDGPAAKAVAEDPPATSGTAGTDVACAAAPERVEREAGAAAADPAQMG